MKKKIVCILLGTLVIAATVLPVSGHTSSALPFTYGDKIDQRQENCGDCA